MDIQVSETCWACHGSGTFTVEDPAPIIRRNRHNASGQHPPRPPEPGPTKEFEYLAARWLFLGIVIGGSYYGITHTAYEWYWPVLASFGAGVVFLKLSEGPLRFLLVALKYALLTAIIGGGVFPCLELYQKWK